MNTSVKETGAHTSLRSRDVSVHRFHKLHDGILANLLVPALDRRESGAGHKRDLIAIEFVEGQQLSDLPEQPDPPQEIPTSTQRNR